MNTDHTDCPTCHGTGQYTVIRPIRRYEKMEPSFCPDCGGSGKKPEKLKPVRVLPQWER